MIRTYDGSASDPVIVSNPDDRLVVLMARRRFSSDHAWSELSRYWPADLASRVDVMSVDEGEVDDYLRCSSTTPDVLVPFMAPLSATTIRLGRFRLIQQFGVGTEAIDVEAATRAGVWVANMPGLNAVPVAEHAIALLLALARRLPEAREGFRPGHWGEPSGRTLRGLTVCIVGLGAIGTEIARRLDAFEVELIGVRRSRPPAAAAGHLPSTLQVVTSDRIHEALTAADAVVVAAGHTPGRAPVLDAAAIAAMPTGAILVNVARGGVIDNEAALDAVRTGHLAGLGLDVFPEEPYPLSGPLLAHPRVLATAHAAALTSDYFRAAAARLGDTLSRLAAGQPPANPLNDVPPGARR